MSIDKKMELLSIRVNIREEPRITMTRFQSDLNYEIRDRVELLPYNDLNNLVQLCVREKQQLKRIFIYRKDYPETSYPRMNSKREDYPFELKYESHLKK